MNMVSVMSSQWQALFCDTVLLRMAENKKVWVFACGYNDFGYFVECLFLACLLYDWRVDRCLATRLSSCSQTSASMVSFAYLRPQLFEC